MGDNALPRSYRLPSERPSAGCAVEYLLKLLAAGMYAGDSQDRTGHSQWLLGTHHMLMVRPGC